jgi:hypothetical protein
VAVGEQTNRQRKHEGDDELEQAEDPPAPLGGGGIGLSVP